MKSKVHFLRIFSFLLVFLILVVLYWNWPTERGSKVMYTTVQGTHSGRIIALPHESIRTNLTNGRIYIKTGEKTYRIKENYLKPNTFTHSLVFNDGWHKLKENEYLIISEVRSIHTTSNFVYLDNIVTKDRIQKTLSKGTRRDIVFEAIDSTKEFTATVETKYLSWKTQTSGPVNIKNFAKPLLYEDTLYIPTTENHLLALDKTTGKQKWEAAFDKPINYILPQYDRMLLFIYSNDEHVIALAKDTGTRIWQAQSKSYIRQPDVYSLEVALTFYDGRLRGLDKKTGEERWNVDIGEKDISYPYYQLTHINDTPLLIVKNDGTNLIALDPNTGKESWKIMSTSQIVDTYNHEDILIIRSRNIAAKSINDHTDRPKSMTDQSIQAIDMATGALIWKALMPDNHTIGEFKLELDSLFLVESQGDTIIVSRRLLTSGQIIWQKILTQAGLHGKIFSLDQDFLVLRTGDGGSSFEDWPIKERVYGINTTLGTLVLNTPLPSYATLHRTGNTLMISQHDIDAYDLAQTKKIWHYRGQKDDANIALVTILDDKKSALYVRNKDVFERLSLDNGAILWSRNLNGDYGHVYNESDRVYILDYEGLVLREFDPENGQEKWKTENVYSSEQPHMQTDGSVIYKKFQRTDWRKFHMSLFVFDSKSQKEVKLMDHMVLTESDMLVQHDASNIYVYVDDFIYTFAIKN